MRKQRVGWVVSGCLSRPPTTGKVAASLLLLLALVPSGGRAEPERRSGIGFRLPGADDLKQASKTLLAPRGALETDATLVGQRADALADTVPALEYDLLARAQSLAGIEATFAFVRDRIGFEPYRGVLRGSHGAYLARAGNAADRALLLGHMLMHGGVEIRYARGTPSLDVSRRLLARTFEAPAAAPPAPVEHPVDASPAERLLERLRKRAARDYAALRSALGDALPMGGPDETTLLDEIADHWWVQAQVDGEWVDLDPSLADAVPGKALCDVVTTFTEVGDDLCQRITFRVVVETLQGGTLETATVLEHTGTVVGLLDRQIVLTHVRGGGGGLAGSLGAGVAASAGGELWTPVLVIHGVPHAGDPVAFAEAANAAERGKPSRGGLGGMLGGGGTLAAAPPLLVAESLEFEIAFPDGGTEITRRVLFDRGGAAWRAAASRDASGLRPFERARGGLAAPQTIHGVFLTAGRHDLAEYARASQIYARIEHEVADSPDQPFGFRVWPFLLQSFALPVLSDHVVVPALNDRPDVRLYAAAPRIFVASIGPYGENGVEITYDLRKDRLRGVTRDAAARPALAERRLWFAALEGALEHELMADTSMGMGLDPTGVESTSALLPADGRLAVISAGKEVPEEALPQDADTVQRIQEAVATGVTVVLPRVGGAGATTAGWWEIEGDGHVRAVLGHGNAGRRRAPTIRDPYTDGTPNTRTPSNKGWQVPDIPEMPLPRERNPPGGQPRGKRPNFDMDWYKKHRGRQMPPTMDGEKGASATEYVGTSKEAAEAVFALVAPIFVEYLFQYAVTAVAAQVEDAVSTAYLADRMGA